MKLSENEINTGIIIKALYENVLNGKSSYTIDPSWQAIIEPKILVSYQSVGLLKYNENVLTLTHKGFDVLQSLFITNEAILISEIMQQIYKDAEKIVTHFNQFSKSISSS